MSLVAGTPLVDVYSYWPDTNQLDSVLLSTGVERRFTYDGAGNVIATNRGALAHSYTYDAANRMSSFAVNGVVQAQYQYNHLGQQVVRHLTASGQTIHSVHDALGNRIAEYDYDPGTGTSTLIREYIWAGGMIVGVVENGTLYFVRTDHIGRPVFATDDAGVKVWEATYLPFGGVHTSSGLNSDLRFPGQWFQSETGLHQNWMRDYDPTTGRYMQADPLGLVDGASMYGYALQNPGRYVDPTGLQSEAGLLTCPAGGPLNPICAGSAIITACKYIIIGGGLIGGGLIGREILMSTPENDDDCSSCDEETDLSHQFPDPSEVDRRIRDRRDDMGGVDSEDNDQNYPPQSGIDDYFDDVGGPFTPDIQRGGKGDVNPGRQSGTTRDGTRPRRDDSSIHSDGFGSNPSRGPRR